MTVLFHPEFPQDIRRFEANYQQISTGLAIRFRAEVDAALDAIKGSPTGAGHFLNTGSSVVREFSASQSEGFPFLHPVWYRGRTADFWFGHYQPIRSVDMAGAL